MKVCTKCKDKKELDAFYINASSPDGRYSICRQCKYASQRKSPILPDGKLHCYVCQETKESTLFRAGTRTYKRICKLCASNKDKQRRAARDLSDPKSVERRKEWFRKDYLKNKDRVRNLAYLKKYNISLDQYNEILLSQGGVCGICRNAEARIDNRSGATFNLAVDHDHLCCPGDNSCGKCIRGLLCGNCNTKLGWFEGVAKQATEWIERRAI